MSVRAIELWVNVNMGDVAPPEYLVRVKEDDFKGENDLPIGRALFWDRLQALPVVEAESFEGDAFCMTGMLDARELEIEGPDGS